MLYSLQKYATAARVIVLADKSEQQYVAKLEEIFPLHAVLAHVNEAALELVLA